MHSLVAGHSVWLVLKANWILNNKVSKKVYFPNCVNLTVLLLSLYLTDLSTNAHCKKTLPPKSSVSLGCFKFRRKIECLRFVTFSVELPTTAHRSTPAHPSWTLCTVHHCKHFIPHWAWRVQSVCFLRVKTPYSFAAWMQPSQDSRHSYTRLHLLLWGQFIKVQYLPLRLKSMWAAQYSHNLFTTMLYWKEIAPDAEAGPPYLRFK